MVSDGDMASGYISQEYKCGFAAEVSGAHG